MQQKTQTLLGNLNAVLSNLAINKIKRGLWKIVLCLAITGNKLIKAKIRASLYFFKITKVTKTKIKQLVNLIWILLLISMSGKSDPNRAQQSHSKLVDGAIGVKLVKLASK